MIRLRIVWSAFPLKMIVGGSICPLPWLTKELSDVILTPWRTNHILCYLSSQCILMGSCQKILIFHPYYPQVKREQQFLADWNTGSVFQVKNLSTQPQLEENDELWSCIRSFASFEISQRTMGNANPLMPKSMSTFHHLVQQKIVPVATYLKNYICLKLYIIRYWTSSDHSSHCWIVYIKHFCFLGKASINGVM